MKWTPVCVVLLLSSPAACADGANGTGRGRIEDSSAGTVALGIDSPREYRELALASSGGLEGSVIATGMRPDSVVAVTRDTSVCGASANVTETRADSAGGALADALVWVAGLTSGKPLPEVRRERLTIERCRFEPRVMAVTTGSTINVFSRDPAVHDTRFYRENDADPVAHVHTVDEGQVVPTEAIASKPGIVEARCAMHPWARAYIAVFDHPYFAVTDAHGQFRIDSLPPGTYTVKIWHERLRAPVEQRVVIGPGGTGHITPVLPLGDIAATSADSAASRAQ